MALRQRLPDPGKIAAVDRLEQAKGVDVSLARGGVPDPVLSRKYHFY
jgi:hypothetical protein